MVANESVTRRAVYMHPKQQKLTNENWDLTYSLVRVEFADGNDYNIH